MREPVDIGAHERQWRVKQMINQSQAAEIIRALNEMNRVLKPLNKKRGLDVNPTPS